MPPGPERPGESHYRRRRERQSRAFADLEPAGDCRLLAEAACRRPGDRRRFAGGRVTDEAGPIEFDAKTPQHQRHPLEDLRQRIGADVNLSGGGLEFDCDPLDDRPEVEGTHLSGDDDSEVARTFYNRDRRGRPSLPGRPADLS